MPLAPAPVTVILLAAAVTLAGWIGTGLVLRFLRRRRILDRPNARSSHSRPTPRGGGLAVTPLVAACWLAASAVSAGGAWSGAVVAAALLALGLGVVSWIDDIRSLGAAPRLMAQIVAVAGGLWATFPVAGGPWTISPLAEGPAGPAWLWLPLCFLAWMWFVNLFNFMDGIDGIAGVQTITVAGAVAALLLVDRPEPGLWVLPVTLAAAMLGFLIWNWHPAKLFLGDVGSVPVGYLLGWLLLLLVVTGEWPAAVILPLYYWVDATVTLLRRLLRGERVWHAHKEHFYQKAVGRGWSHGGVAMVVLACNTGLVGSAFLARGDTPVWGFLAAAACVGAALLVLALRPRAVRSTGAEPPAGV